MANKKVSIIIPAYNEERFIGNTLGHYRSQDYPLEIIVVVNNSNDKTYKIAEKYSDRVLNFPGKIGISRARNEGANAATGDIFIFSDADSWIEKGGIKKIIDEFIIDDNIVGPLLGKGDIENIRGKLIFAFKNLINMLSLHRGGVAGVIFCSREMFFKIGGFLSEKEPAEQRDFFIKAEKCGAKYKIINSFAYTSMRRYEQQGYIRALLFWPAWRFFSLFKAEKNMAKDYYEIKK